jgi:hypothetical protein
VTVVGLLVPVVLFVVVFVGLYVILEKQAVSRRTRSHLFISGFLLVCLVMLNIALLAVEDPGARLALVAISLLVIGVEVGHHVRMRRGLDRDTPGG